MTDKDFKDYQAGDFIEVFNPKFKLWVLCQIVTNYGMIKSGDEYKWGYEIEIIKEDLEKKINKKYKMGSATWVITEDMGSKWYREAPPAAKVLYSGRKPRREEPEDDDLPF